MVQSLHPHKGPFASELHPGDLPTGFYLCRHKRLEPFRDRSKGKFLTLILSDRTGQILARVWEGAEELAGEFEQGAVVKVSGEVEEYLGRRQVIIHRLRAARDTEFDLRDFLPASQKDPAELSAALEEAVNRISDSHLSALVRHFYDDPGFTEQLRQAPASSRIHHAYLGGLLEHLVEVVRLAEAALELYPGLDADLLRAGVLLHDVGKLRDFARQTDIRYSDEGRLIGYVVAGEEMVAWAIRGIPTFPEELALRIRHMMVSQRGKFEYGSPRRPMTLEALALHKLDDLSVQVNRFQTLLARPYEPGATWSEFDRRLGHSLFLGVGNEDLPEEVIGDEI